LGTVPVRSAEAETSSGGGSSDGSCIGAYRCLRSLLQLWRSDAEGGDETTRGIASHLLQRFYGWLAAPSSALHDPALQRLVQRQMRSTLDALLRTLRGLGCGLVAASFDRVVVHLPGRHTREAAWGALGHAVAKLAASPLFSYVTVTPRRAWRALLWYDEANYSGLSLELPRLLGQSVLPLA
jgi:hypothetical protein